MQSFQLISMGWHHHVVFYELKWLVADCYLTMPKLEYLLILPLFLS